MYSQCSHYQCFSQVQHYLLIIPMLFAFRYLPIPECQLWHTDYTGGSSSAGFLRSCSSTGSGNSGNSTGDRPHLWSVPRNPQFRPFGLSFQGLWKRGSNSHTYKKRERTVELTPPEIQSHQKATRTRKAVARSKAADPFREKGKENMGN